MLATDFFTAKEFAMRLTLAQRAAKIRDHYPEIPTEVIQQDRGFYDEVWSLCGAIMDDSTDSSQFVPSTPIMK
jgi:hypothetical protein